MLHDAWHNPVAPHFAQALLNPGLEKPSTVVGPNGKAAEKRFNVYRNNVAYSLVEALGQNYPAVKAQCGEARFNDAASLYLADHPPRTKLMFELGAGFADWLDAFEPAQAQMPWLADLARLERAWLNAYHAEDAAPLDPALLSSVSPEAFADMRFIKHPAASIVQSPFSILTMFQMGRSGEAYIGPHETQDVLITRPHFDVEMRLLPAGGAIFFDSLFEGTNLVLSAEASVQETPDFDLSSALGFLLQSGAMAALQ